MGAYCSLVFQRFAIAMDFLAIAVLDRELHQRTGLAMWRLAQKTETYQGRFAKLLAERAERLRDRAAMLGASASCVRRSRSLVRQSRGLLDARLVGAPFLARKS